MPNKRYTPEQIINSLREVEVLISQGKDIFSTMWKRTLLFFFKNNALIVAETTKPSFIFTA